MCSGSKSVSSRDPSSGITRAVSQQQRIAGNTANPMATYVPSTATIRDPYSITTGDMSPQQIAGMSSNPLAAYYPSTMMMQKEWERNQERKRLQAEYDKQAQAMEAARAAQQAEMQRLQQLQIQAAADQQAQMAAQQAQEQQQMAQIQLMRDATSTVGASLRVLASQPRAQAPTARVSTPSRSSTGRAASPSTSLRIGSSGRSAGVGVNMGG